MGSKEKLKDLEIIRGKDFLQPPLDLTRKEVAQFTRIVKAYSPDHFVDADLELLKNYAKNYVVLDEVNKQLRLVPILSKEYKHCISIITQLNNIQASLGTKLRVVPNSRMTRTDSATVLNETRVDEDEEFGDLI